MIIIFGCRVHASADTLTLAWDANSETDLYSYRIYYRIGSSGGRILSFYDGEGLQFRDGPLQGGTVLDSGDHIDKDTFRRNTTIEVAIQNVSPSQLYCFAVTAVNTQSDESVPSNEACTGREYLYQHQTGDQGGGGGCFIATVVFDSELSSKVRILNRFRDRFLRLNTIGKYLIELYYHKSPPIAYYIRKKTQLKFAFRFVLLPIIGIAYVFLAVNPLILAAGLMVSFFLIIRKQYVRG